MALAAGAERIGESGTGCGVGLAWLASGMRPSARAVSVEREAARVAVATELFADDPRVSVEQAGWTRLHDFAPFDLLVLDGGGQGKDGSPPADPTRLLTPGGVLVMDDFAPATAWPPLHAGQPDAARIHWLQHPELRTIEIPLAPDAATLVCVRRHPER